jgi:hypothetical protein
MMNTPFNILIGKVLAIGAEWSSYNRQTGYFVSDARYHLQTLDRAEIAVSLHGNTAIGGLIHVHAKFETGAAKYLWLNDILAVGIITSTRLGYMVDMWQVVSPKYAV